MDSKPKSYCSIDPGSTGSLCCYIPSQEEARFMDTEEHPRDIMYWIEKQIEETEIQSFYIEEVHAIYGSAAKSTFKFGFNCGIYWLCKALYEDISYVQPKIWQKAIGVKSKGKDVIKQEVKDIVLKVVPEAKIHSSRGKLRDGRSDALGIAYYASNLK